MIRRVLCVALFILASSILISCGQHQSPAVQPMSSSDQEDYRRYLQQDTIRKALEAIDKIDSVNITMNTPSELIINIVHARGVNFKDSERLAIEETAANAAPDVARENLRFHYGLQMTLADVIALAQKGEALTMADVREYVGHDPLSGLYGWQCEVFSNQTDESSAFVLNATSGGQDATLMHAYLYRAQIHAAPPSPSANDADPGIDIRYYDVMAYAERGEKLLVRPLPTEPPPSGDPKIPPHASDL